MPVDALDPKETAALLMQAEASVHAQNERRAELLQPDMPETNTADIADYLNKYDPQLSALAKKYPVLFEEFLGTFLLPRTEENEGGLLQQPSVRLFDPLKKLTEFEQVYLRVGLTTVMTKERLGHFKAVVLHQCEQGSQSETELLDTIRQNFATKLVSMLSDQGITPPVRYRLYASTPARETFYQDREDDTEFFGKLLELPGSLEKIHENPINARMDELLSERQERQELVRFMKEFDGTDGKDPRQIIDLVLSLEKGEMPL